MKRVKLRMSGNSRGRDDKKAMIQRATPVNRNDAKQGHKKQKIDKNPTSNVNEEDTYDLSSDEYSSDSSSTQSQSSVDDDDRLSDINDENENDDDDSDSHNSHSDEEENQTSHATLPSLKTSAPTSTSNPTHNNIKRTTPSSSIPSVSTSGKPQDSNDSISAMNPNDKSKKPVTFESLGVCAPLCNTLRKLQWKAPTSIQEHGIPLALANKDVIGLAATGSGKTGCFVIPMLQSLLRTPQAYYALILSPTRELAFQIHEQIQALGSDIGVSSVAIVGGVDMMNQAIALAKRPHIIVASPGRIVDHLENTKGFNLKNLKYLVLDEADRLLNMDFEREIDKILEVIPKERRTMLFSATMTSKVAKLQRASLRDPVKVEVSEKYSTVDQLIQNYIFIPAKYKELYLTYILNELQGQSSIVFCATCESTKKLSLMLRDLGFACLPLHGKMDQQQRLASLNKFRASGHKIHLTDSQTNSTSSTLTPLSVASALRLNGGGKHDTLCNILICTDVASRGLDIPAVDNVINYDIPTHSKDYIHRVGRTARAGRSGRAITFVTQYDVELFQRIESLIGLKMELYATEEDAVMLLSERVMEAHRIAMSALREIEIQKKERRKNKRNGDDDVENSASIDLSKHKNSSYKKKRR